MNDKENVLSYLKCTSQIKLSEERKIFINDSAPKPEDTSRPELDPVIPLRRIPDNIVCNEITTC